MLVCYSVFIENATLPLSEEVRAQGRQGFEVHDALCAATGRPKTDVTRVSAEVRDPRNNFFLGYVYRDVTRAQVEA